MGLPHTSVLQSGHGRRQIRQDPASGRSLELRARLDTDRLRRCSKRGASCTSTGSTSMTWSTGSGMLAKVVLAGNSEDCTGNVLHRSLGVGAGTACTGEDGVGVAPTGSGSGCTAAEKETVWAGLGEAATGEGLGGVTGAVAAATGGVLEVVPGGGPLPLAILGVGCKGTKRGCADLWGTTGT